MNTQTYNDYDKFKTELLPGANLRGICLRGNRYLSQINLRGADLTESDLGSTILEDADLSDVVFCKANLSCADLRRADLRGADFSDCLLSNARLHDALVDEGKVIDNIGGSYKSKTPAGDFKEVYWHALLIDSGKVILQFGAQRASLESLELPAPWFWSADLEIGITDLKAWLADWASRPRWANFEGCK